MRKAKVGGADSLFEGHPKNLDEAVDDYLSFYSKAEDLEEVMKGSEDDFIAMAHHFSGQFLRNSYFLWWWEGHKYDSWPMSQPPISEYFYSIGITHADDMSSIILKSAYRKYNKIPIDLEDQVKYYQDFWKKNGFKDGVFIPE